MSRGCSGGLPSLCSIRGSKIPMASVLLGAAWARREERSNREICSPSRRTSTRYSDRIFLLRSQTSVRLIAEPWRRLLVAFLVREQEAGGDAPGCSAEVESRVP